VISIAHLKSTYCFFSVSKFATKCGHSRLYLAKRRRRSCVVLISQSSKCL